MVIGQGIVLVLQTGENVTFALDLVIVPVIAQMQVVDGVEAVRLTTEEDVAALLLTEEEAAEVLLHEEEVEALTVAVAAPEEATAADPLLLLAADPLEEDEALLLEEGATAHLQGEATPVLLSPGNEKGAPRAFPLLRKEQGHDPLFLALPLHALLLLVLPLLALPHLPDPLRLLSGKKG
mmetsp:Transcript_29642/g.40939  ORF Transcript_29642/g.40939 Transcript_29642/m.40939 type:complete len:180 (+) Transcript_29642:61-600(+)|eukprot:CAMPEP_0201488408 /NCGR_PEP_ID=MMETSP0151_2-20130828/18028_1 /ASSEMBLY_ACC=CAM_ASM_000257 /TAXON_ID=200890 /ORGANISM="Paramoeba atlantica, Strain 621/1 / CCAP 1560/9" /LENGTH=179 /DNA_ID=CAMNT_0047873689 /DNA_START=57 /DNA_END=596 /DNA_ORIENTATION=-